MGITNQIPSSRLLQAGVVDNTAARPASPYEGQVIFQKDTDQLLVWNGTAWVIPNQTTQNPEGFELVKTQVVGTGVSSVTVSNVFSDTYDNYKIHWSGASSLATGNGINIQMGSTTSGYFGTMIYASYAGAGPYVVGENSIANWTHCAGAAQNQIALDVDLFNPFKTQITSISALMYTDNANAGKKSGWLNDATSYTSFTFLVATGTITGGTIRVYGYRKTI